MTDPDKLVQEVLVPDALRLHAEDHVITLTLSRRLTPWEELAIDGRFPGLAVQDGRHLVYDVDEAGDDISFEEIVMFLNESLSGAADWAQTDAERKHQRVVSDMRPVAERQGFQLR